MACTPLKFSGSTKVRPCLLLIPGRIRTDLRSNKTCVKCPGETPAINDSKRYHLGSFALRFSKVHSCPCKLRCLAQHLAGNRRLRERCLSILRLPPTRLASCAKGDQDFSLDRDLGRQERKHQSYMCGILQNPRVSIARAPVRPYSQGSFPNVLVVYFS